MTELLSYNESSNQRLKLRHVFLPGTYGLISEAIIAVLALLLFNASQLSGQFLGQGVNADDPASLLFHPLRQLLNNFGQHYIIQQTMLFGLWVIVGALIYILVFRTLQISFSVKHSVGTGVQLIRQDPNRGLFRWLASLHDFFVKALITFLGIVAVAIGAIVCFGIASQELNNGLARAFPLNVGLLLISLVAAVLSVRVIVIGITLLSPRFRVWYNA